MGSGTNARIEHFLLDFGDSFGSDSDIAKDPRHGQEDILPTSREQLNRALTLGFKPVNWEVVRYPKELSAVGNFTSIGFDPLGWRPNYPNPAFLAIQPEDGYWAAKRVMQFSNEQILAIVEEGRFSNPAVSTYIAKVLEERRDKIGRAWYMKVLPLEDFAIESDHLKFADIGPQAGLPARHVDHYDWFQFDNSANRPLAHYSSDDAIIPAQILGAAEMEVTSVAPSVLPMRLIGR